MKKIKVLMMLSAFIAGFTMHLVAQDGMTLPEVTVLAKNYKYLKSVNHKDAAQPVKLLERKAAAYDVKNSEYYGDDNENYYITFFLPEGYVLAVYDQDGKLLRTAERFKDVTLPPAVRNAVAKRYPNWRISKDLYQVKYGGADEAKFHVPYHAAV